MWHWQFLTFYYWYGEGNFHNCIAKITNSTIHGNNGGRLTSTDRSTGQELRQIAHPLCGFLQCWWTLFYHRNLKLSMQYNIINFLWERKIHLDCCCGRRYIVSVQIDGRGRGRMRHTNFWQCSSIWWRHEIPRNKFHFIHWKVLVIIFEFFMTSSSLLHCIFVLCIYLIFPLECLSASLIYILQRTPS